MYPSAMWRFLLRYLLVVAAITVGAGLAYTSGAPAWIVYAGGALTALILAPACVRWEKRQV